jgi:hypothetical protein
VHGKTWQQIADEVGYSSPASAYAAVREYFKNYPPSPGVEALRRIENEKLDALEDKMWEVIRASHAVVNQRGVVSQYKLDGNGRVILLRDETGEFMTTADGKPMYETEPLDDDAPVVQAVRTLVQVYNRRAKLNGLDMPIKIEVDSGEVDQEIVELVQEMQTMGVPAVPKGHEG